MTIRQVKKIIEAAGVEPKDFVAPSMLTGRDKRGVMADANASVERLTAALIIQQQPIHGRDAPAEAAMTSMAEDFKADLEKIASVAERIRNTFPLKDSHFGLPSPENARGLYYALTEGLSKVVQHF